MKEKTLLKNIYNRVRESYIEYLLEFQKLSDVITIIWSIPDYEDQFTTCFYALYTYADMKASRDYRKKALGNRTIYERINSSRRELPREIVLVQNEEGTIKGLEDLLPLFISPRNPLIIYFDKLLQEQECLTNII